MPEAFDLDAYLSRIGVDAPRVPDLAALKRLHRAHVETIPFENLDIQMRVPIQIDAESIQAALVRRRRGGYCFQQNGLFRLALSALGFTPQAREGRVRLDAHGVIRPRTHMVLAVPLEGELWLADVGFGGHGLAEPIVIGGTPVTQDGWTYRTLSGNTGVAGLRHVLQRANAGGWDDLYAFGDDEVPQIDYVVGNWYTSAHPDSHFLHGLTAQRMRGRTRHILRNLTYTVTEEGRSQTRDIARADLVPLLREIFGIDVPADARFRAIDE